MSRLVKIPIGKQIKPLLGPYMLLGGKTHKIANNWILPDTYTDGTLIVHLESSEGETKPKKKEETTSKKPKPKPTKRPPFTPPKDTKPKTEEDDDQ
tara:strand:- start:35314 stop:35601 length:288 start_codon:yes stop_codon:yes gene_type:complete